MTVVAARNLHYAYEDAPILGRLSFDVDAGEFFILIGPNGSGKTTLMRVLAGLLRAGGELKLFDRDIRSFGRKELARRVAYVPQYMSADIPFTVEETVFMGRSPHLGALGLGGAADQELVRRAMEFTGVTHLAGRRLRRLSGGELQRAFIARALCQAPEIILLDEPTAFLDMGHQVQIMDLLEKMKQEKGVAVIMVSHDINMAAMYADRMLLLKSGRLAGLGPPAEVMTFSALEAAYECVVVVDESPLGRIPRVTPAPGKFRPS